MEVTRKWADLEIMVLSEVTQAQKYSSCMPALMCACYP